MKLQLERSPPRKHAFMHSGTGSAIGILRLHLSRASRATNSAQDDSLVRTVVQGSLTDHLLLCGEYWFQFRFRWNDDPCEQVGDDARTNAGRERDEDAEDANEGYVEIEMLGQPGANTCNLSVGSGGGRVL